MGRLLAALVVLAFACRAQAQTHVDQSAKSSDGPTMPTISTADAELGTVAVGPGRLHATWVVDTRNADYVRGQYDLDEVGLNRVPVIVQTALGWELAQDEEGKPTSWLLFRMSNGFHSPRSEEPDSPRAWYKAAPSIQATIMPLKGLTAGASYTWKVFPNGFAPTTQEANATVAYDGGGALGALHPSAIATWRTAAGRGYFLQAGVTPRLELSSRTGGPTLTFPLRVGVGWADFYSATQREAVYGSVGASFTQPIGPPSSRLAFRIDFDAVVRDDGLRKLGGPRADRSTLVPIAVASLTKSY